MQTAPRSILGAFIRAHRERQPPPRVGERRRTPGLRREELAEAAGVGTTWITWLEQGRAVSASPAALARLADALHLNTAERTSLFDLAGRRDPVAPAQPQSEVAPALLALPALFTGPAYLLDHTWTARAWNSAAARLFGGWLDQGSDRNLMHFVFLSPVARVLIVDWPERTRRLVAEFRADFSRRPREPGLHALVDRLLAESPVFCQLWQAQSVLHREGGERQFNHPEDGMLRFAQTTLLVASQQDCKLVCLAPKDVTSA